MLFFFFVHALTVNTGMVTLPVDCQLAGVDLYATGDKSNLSPAAMSAIFRE